MSKQEQQEKEGYYIPRSGPMPRPKSVDEARSVLSEECFKAPNCQEVKFETKEFTSVCPRTGQPDFQTIKIKYIPDELCIESKSMKFYLWSYRQYGAFCETLVSMIADDIMDAIAPKRVEVTIEQNIRGGLALDSTAVRVKEEDDE